MSVQMRVFLYLRHLQPDTIFCSKPSPFIPAWGQDCDTLDLCHNWLRHCLFHHPKLILRKIGKSHHELYSHGYDKCALEDLLGKGFYDELFLPINCSQLLNKCAERVKISNFLFYK